MRRPWDISVNGDALQRPQQNPRDDEVVQHVPPILVCRTCAGDFAVLYDNNLGLEVVEEFFFSPEQLVPRIWFGVGVQTKNEWLLAASGHAFQLDNEIVIRTCEVQVTFQISRQHKDLDPV